MSIIRLVMWILGIGLLLSGVYLFYFEANLSRWFSLTLLAAGVLAFLGLVVLGFAGGRGDDSRTTVMNDDSETGRRETQTTIVKHE